MCSVTVLDEVLDKIKGHLTSRAAKPRCSLHSNLFMDFLLVAVECAVPAKYLGTY